METSDTSLAIKGLEESDNGQDTQPEIIYPNGQYICGANLLNPLVRGWQNYYCHFIKRNLNDLWRFINRSLEKWCKWNKQMNLYKSRRWLNTLYKMQPGLVAHWSVCPAY
ncbi:MAG TPA: group II intron maturase-specific domain-containing protein [Hanamia sp.]